TFPRQFAFRDAIERGGPDREIPRRRDMEPTPNTLTYCGHSTILLVSEHNERIIIDPWLDGNPRCPEKLQSISSVDIIALTHGHSDHSGSAVALAKRTGATVVATFELCGLLEREGVPGKQLLPMNKGGTARIGKSGSHAITLTHAFHSSSFAGADGVARYAGEPCGIILRLDDSITIYHAGDTALFGDMQLIGARYRPDVSLLPIGDCFTMGPEEAAQAARMLQTRCAIPIHFKTFDALTGTAEAFSAAMENVDAEVVVLEPGDSFDLPR
ncbi:MAG: metal-dependent hydrolase, partial [Bdellovibrionales bacterium]|nr:metal-dependent hydrolase [Bdellovibrionales bacterium]